MKRAFAVCVLAVTLLMLGCRDNAPPDVNDTGESRQAVSLALNWFPEAEHGGFYAALVHGYFEEEGLDVTILPGGPGAPVIQQVASKQIPFAVANADQVLLGREQGAPITAVMTAMQDSPRCIMVHEESGIERLQDLDDVTLAVGAGKPFARFLLRELGDPPGLKIVPFQGNVSLFLQRKDFAQQAYVFSEPFLARKQGANPRALMVSELGFNPYTSLLITNDALVQADPDLVGKMVRASVRGWKKYLEDPEPTNEYINKQNSEMPLDVLAYGAKEIAKLCQSGEGGTDSLGVMSDERWKTLAGQLKSIGLLEMEEVWRDAFAAQFVSSGDGETSPPPAAADVEP